MTPVLVLRRIILINHQSFISSKGRILGQPGRETDVSLYFELQDPHVPAVKGAAKSQMSYLPGFASIHMSNLPA